MGDEHVVKAAVATLLVGLVSLGCATASIENVPLARFEAGAGYGAKLEKLPYEDRIRIVLAFFGRSRPR